MEEQSNYDNATSYKYLKSYTVGQSNSSSVQPITLADIYQYMTVSVPQNISENKDIANISTLFQFPKEILSNPDFQYFVNKNNDLKRFGLQKHLISQLIGPNTHDLLFVDELYQWCISSLHSSDINISSPHISISGPSQSGKSTLLFILVQIYLIATISAQISDSLFFIPINFEKIRPYMNFFEFYQQMLNLVNTSLRYSAPEVLPFSAYLNSYFSHFSPSPLFITDISKTLPKKSNIKMSEYIPPSKQLCEIYPKIGDFSKSLHSKLNSSNIKNSEQLIMEGIASFPVYFAEAINKTPILILDHFDCCPEQYQQIFCDLCQKYPHFVAPKNLNSFSKIFNIKNSVSFSSDLALPEIQQFKAEFKEIDKIINVSNLNLTLEPEDCLRCPALLAKFWNVCQSYENLKRPVTRAEMSQETIAKMKFIELCLALRNIESPKITQNILQQLYSTEFNITISSNE